MRYVFGVTCHGLKALCLVFSLTAGQKNGRSDRKKRFGPNIGHGLFVGWVEHPDIFCWVSILYPTYFPAIFVLSAKPNKISEIENPKSKMDQLLSTCLSYTEFLPAPLNGKVGKQRAQADNKHGH